MQTAADLFDVFPQVRITPANPFFPNLERLSGNFVYRLGLHVEFGICHFFFMGGALASNH
jgi:hypothetical protein